MKFESEEMKELWGLVKEVESTLAIKHPNQHDDGFRTMLLAKAADASEEMPAHFIRVMYEAACTSPVSARDIEQFRYRLQLRMAAVYGLRRVAAAKKAA